MDRGALRRFLLYVISAVLLAAPVLLLGVGAAASVGAGVGERPITAPGLVPAGQETDLTGLYVVNTGTERSTYRIKVQPISDAAERPVPTSWIRFGLNDKMLDPRESVVVPLHLSVPESAAPGDYRSYLVASTVSPAEGTSLGAAAATELRFTVTEPRDGPSWWRAALPAVLLAGPILALAGGILAMRGKRERSLPPPA